MGSTGFRLYWGSSLASFKEGTDYWDPCKKSLKLIVHQVEFSDICSGMVG